MFCKVGRDGDPSGAVALDSLAEVGELNVEVGVVAAHLDLFARLFLHAPLVQILQFEALAAFGVSVSSRSVPSSHVRKGSVEKSRIDGVPNAQPSVNLRRLFKRL